MKKYFFAVLCAVSIACSCGTGNIAAASQTFNVKDFGAVGDGVYDDSSAIQSAIDQAIKAGAGNTVLLPSGTFLLDAQLTIENCHNLTFTGSGTGRTMIWYSLKHPTPFYISSDDGLTLKSFSTDVRRLQDTGDYELGETQGQITSIDAATKTITLKVEPGYPLLTRPDIENAPAVGWHNAWIILHADPSRMDVDDPGGYSPQMLTLKPSADGITAAITVDYIPSRIYVGEQWVIYPGLGNICFNICYNPGAISLQDIDYYGGAVNWMGALNYTDGPVIFNHLYCGPPPYQPDRSITCNEGWAMSQSSRGSLTISNSTFLKTFDDIFDRGCDSGQVLSQPKPDAVLIKDNPGNEYQAGDTTEFYDYGGSVVGTNYATSIIASVARQPDGDWLLHLAQPLVVRYPSKDYCSDLSQAGPVVAQNCTFNCASGRNVYFRSGKSVTVTDCRFEDNTPLMIGGWENGEGPGEPVNVTITGCTFSHSQGLAIEQNGGDDKGVTGRNIVVSGNAFINCGQYDVQDSLPLTIANVAGATVSHNVFYNNWGVNARFAHDQSVAITQNTFVYPNQIMGDNGDDDACVMSMTDLTTGSISGNIVHGAGPFTHELDKIGPNVTNVTGEVSGISDFEGAAAMYLPYDNLTIAGSTSSSQVYQAKWDDRDKEEWLFSVLNDVPGMVTVQNKSTGKLLGAGKPSGVRSPIQLQIEELLPDASHMPEEQWSLNNFGTGADNIINRSSCLALHVKGDSALPGAELIQWHPADKECQRVSIISAPRVFSSVNHRIVTLNWSPGSGLTDYVVKRSQNPGGPYKILATGLNSSSYIDNSAISGTHYYVLEGSADLNVKLSSNEVSADVNAPYLPVDIRPACNSIAIQPAGWSCSGPGLDGTGQTLPSKRTGQYVNWKGMVLPLGDASLPDAAIDAGQKIKLPNGHYSSLYLVGFYADDRPSSSAACHVSVSYMDGSYDKLTQRMTSWCGQASQEGESDAAVYPQRNLRSGIGKSGSCYLHGYMLPINSSKMVTWLTLPDTGSFRIFAVALEDAPH